MIARVRGARYSAISEGICNSMGSGRSGRINRSRIAASGSNAAQYSFIVNCAGLYRSEGGTISLGLM